MRRKPSDAAKGIRAALDHVLHRLVRRIDHLEEDLVRIAVGLSRLRPLMDVRWLLTRETVGAEHSVFGITVFPPGSKHDIHRHPNAEEFEYLVSGRGVARVGDADVELGPGEVVFVPKNDYHGFENTGDEPVFMSVNVSIVRPRSASVCHHEASRSTGTSRRP